MDAQERDRFGAKCARLMAAARRPALAGMVLPLVPIAPLPVIAAADYAAVLRGKRPDLAAEIAAKCGPPPWIVRSSGNEDAESDSNAGGYDSVMCRATDALFDCVAQVALSGYGADARRQAALGGRDSAQAIPCFVQPLLDVRVAGAVEPEQVPYLDDAALDAVDAAIAQILAAFDMAAIDVEWGIETDMGFVSGTSIVARDTAAMTAQHVFGFGFAAGQTVSERPVGSVVVPAGSSLRLRRGVQHRLARLDRLHLLQVRPAAIEPPLRDVAMLSAAVRADLDAALDRRDATMLLAGRSARGAVLAAPTLATAWRSYLGLDAASRDALALVLVGEGSAVEHAGIMFRQQHVTCVTIDIARLPANAGHALFDRDRCWFGPPATIAAVPVEARALMPLPRDCFLSFHDADDPVAEQARLMTAIDALPIDDAVRGAILARSLEPMDDCWLAVGARVASPSFAGVMLRGEAAPAVTDDADAVLSRHPDLRVGVAFHRYRAIVPHGGLRDLAAARIVSGDVRGARLMLELVATMDAAASVLPIYAEGERRAFVAALDDAFRRGADPEQARALLALRLPVPAWLRLIVAVVGDPDLRRPALAFARAHDRFLFAVPGDAVAAAWDLAATSHDLFAAMATTPALDEVAALLRGSLVESYDATLKAVLGAIVAADADDASVYLGVLRAWIAVARDTPLDTGEGVVLDRFDRWIDAFDATPPDDYTIEDRNWRIEFPRIASGEVEAYENAHVLHNLLHQWMLSRTVIGTALLPRALRDLHRLCTTFSMRATKVLRFADALFELEIPMSTHKVSFAFTPDAIAVEWSEPPDCPDDEIARILAFECLLARFRFWGMDGLSWRRERIVGTWTLAIRIAAPTPCGWTLDDYRTAVVTLRLLFDGTYDFSYVENEAVAGFSESLAEGREWQAIFAALLRFRATYDDTAQYVFLHTVPLSSAVATLAQNPVARGLIRRCHRRGFGATVLLIESLGRWLEHGEDASRWARGYELLRQACLYAAAAWPDAVIGYLARRPAGDAGDELLAACTMRRRDMHAMVRALATDGGGTAWFRALVLRHVPDLQADVLDVLQPAGRRAMHYRVAHATATLDDAALERLLAPLDTVPNATDPSEQARIDAILHRRDTGPPLRFDLTRGVDWTALDAWVAAAA